MLGPLLAAALLGVGAISVPVPTAPPDEVLADGGSLTLITGDVVQLTGSGTGGKVAATVTPAAGRERITFHTYEEAGGLRVVPADAVPLIEAGRVDAELFDVQRLVEQGYADADTPTLPLILQGAPPEDGARLASIGATAIRPAKSTLAAFWRNQQVAIQSARTTIFLDGKVEAALDRSTAQIGAPTAWQAGLDGTGVSVAVLDTGVDPTHPDLAGKIKSTANFSSSPDTVDRFGHGTHVAATIAGTGAASPSRSRKGVAYGAELLVGKVLGDDGSGYESEIIAGMQWAVASGARVVNLSLGGEPTDGLDPMGLAVDDLSESSGALFVIAAGNAGPESSTVGSPGSAAAALTVGAVDRDDRMASFSSRGPRVGDLGLKPEITAPGVDIVAARAAGTAMGTVVDDYYVAASGTSMATPHVAGAAAIVAQQHPEWTGQQIKQALVSTATTMAGADVYDQGAGRVDLARAVTQAVTATPLADFGAHRAGALPSTGSVGISYRNLGSSAVTLSLQKPAAVTLSAGTVTVPAGGSASVTATIDFAAQKPGRISGWITGTAPGVSVTTAVGAVLDGPGHKVTISAVDRHGDPTPVPVLNLRGDDSRFDTFSFLGNGSRTFELQEGIYLLDATLDGDTEATFVTIPELTVDRDLTVLVDARKGVPITIETPRPAEQRAVLSYYLYRETGAGRRFAHGVMHFSAVERVFVTPTRKVAAGEFEFSSRWQLEAPMAVATVPGVSDISPYLMGTSPAPDGRRSYPLAKWGGRDLRGRAVLIPASDTVDEYQQIAAAAEAGAAVALLIRPEGRSAWTVWRPDGDRLPLITLAVSHDDGERLLARTPSLLTLTLTTSSPYLYDVEQVSPDRIPDRVVHKVTTANSTRITTTYADNGGLDWVREQRFGWRPWQDYAWNDTSRTVRTPSVREEWVSAGDSSWQHRVHHLLPWSDFGQLQGGFADTVRSYRGGTTSRETWAGGVVRPADLGSTRTGDVLNLRVGEFVDSDGHYEAATSADLPSVKLWRDGTLLGEWDSGRQDVVTGSAQSRYRLEVTTERVSEDWERGIRTDTEWTFGRDAALLGVDYTVQPLGVTLDFDAPLASLRVDYSTDDGRSWRRAAVVGETALVPPGRTPVSLKVTAQDKAGNSLTQTVIRAY